MRQARRSAWDLYSEPSVHRPSVQRIPLLVSRRFGFDAYRCRLSQGFWRKKSLQLRRGFDSRALCPQFMERTARGIERRVDIAIRHGGAQEHIVPWVHIDAALQHFTAPKKAIPQIRILVE